MGVAKAEVEVLAVHGSWRIQFLSLSSDSKTPEEYLRRVGSG